MGLSRATILNFLADGKKGGDTTGVIWGETFTSISQQLPRRVIRETEVYQVVGSMGPDRLPGAEDCAIQISKRIGFHCHTFRAPAILSSKSLAANLCKEPTIEK